MQTTVTLAQLQDEKYTFIQSDSDLIAVLEFVGLPPTWAEHISGAVVKILDGEYGQVYLSESSAPYALAAWYHPLPYYMDTHRGKQYLPAYWQEETYP
jgi:hypothetical protein